MLDLRVTNVPVSKQAPRQYSFTGSFAQQRSHRNNAASDRLDVWCRRLLGAADRQSGNHSFEERDRHLSSSVLAMRKNHIANGHSFLQRHFAASMWANSSAIIGLPK